MRKFSLSACLVTVLFSGCTSSIQPLDLSLFEKNSPVVYIEAYDYDDDTGYIEKVSEGSGTIVDGKGYVMTNFHVIEKENNIPADIFRICISVAIAEDLYCDWAAFLVDSKTDEDIALLRI